MSDEPHDKYAGRPDHEAAGWHPDHGHGMQFRPSRIEVFCPECMVLMTIHWEDRQSLNRCPQCSCEFNPHVGSVREQERWIKLFRRLMQMHADGASLMRAEESRELLEYHSSSGPVVHPGTQVKVELTLEWPVLLEDTGEPER